MWFEQLFRSPLPDKFANRTRSDTKPRTNSTTDSQIDCLNRPKTSRDWPLITAVPA
jgi:hypothetical protein